MTSEVDRQSRPQRRRRIACGAALAAQAMLISGCSNLGVQPWERDLLARPAMQLSTSPVAAAIDDHVYFSKEAASGGRGFGGGGCGCN